MKFLTKSSPIICSIIGAIIGIYILAPNIPYEVGFIIRCLFVGYMIFLAIRYLYRFTR